MPASRAARLEPIQQLADMREEEAMQALAESQRALAEQEARLAELQRYAAEYADASMTVGSPSMIVNRCAFLAKLQDAARFQQKTVEQARLRCEAERARWLLRRRDAGVLDQLAASYNLQARRHDERRLQKEMDEHAAQCASRKQSSGQTSLSR
ncbi:MAG: flagellar export protein FliJ [Stenotrophobium sp.]